MTLEQMRRDKPEMYAAVMTAIECCAKETSHIVVRAFFVGVFVGMIAGAVAAGVGLWLGVGL